MAQPAERGSPYTVREIVSWNTSRCSLDGLTVRLEQFCEALSKLCSLSKPPDTEDLARLQVKHEISTGKPEVFAWAAGHAMCLCLEFLLQQRTCDFRSDLLGSQMVLCAALLGACHHCVSLLIGSGVSVREVRADTRITGCWRGGCWKKPRHCDCGLYKPVSWRTLFLLHSHRVPLYIGTLFRAVKSKDTSAVRALAACGMDVNCYSDYSMTPLQAACCKLQMATAATLLSLGARVNQTSDGSSENLPLHLVLRAMDSDAHNTDAVTLLWLLMWSGATCTWKYSDTQTAKQVLTHSFQIFQLGTAGAELCRRLCRAPTLQEAAAGRLLLQLLGARASWRELRLPDRRLLLLDTFPVVRQLLSRELQAAGLLRLTKDRTCFE